MQFPRCIAISGIDGSGKTTLTNYLVNYFRYKGYKTKHVWIRSPHTFAYIISQILIHIGWHRTIKNPNGLQQIRFELYDGLFARKIWQIIEFVSVLPLVILKVWLPIFLGYRLIFDRCTIDTAVSIAMKTKNNHFLDSYIGNLLLRMVPKDCVTIFLYADLPLILKRRPDIEYSSDELENELKLYETSAEKIKTISFNTTMLSITQTKMMIINSLFPEQALKFPVKRGVSSEFSMVTPTYNRAAKLKDMLESVLQQEMLPKAVIIVDQSGNQSTSNVVKEITERFLNKKILLTYHHINQKSSSKARNFGIDHSKGEIIFFIDDDVVLHKDYTKNILKIYETYPDAVGVQGLILGIVPLTKAQTLKSHLTNQLKRAFSLSYYQENVWTVMPSINDVFPFPLTIIAQAQRLQGCCSYKRAILDYFRYDENLGGWAFLEDLDLSYRIYKSTTGSLYITPEAKILHNEHIHMSSSLKDESYKKIVNRTYIFFKLIDHSLYNYAIFCWGIFGFLLSTTIGIMFEGYKKKSKWLPIYLIEATVYTLRHLKNIKQLKLENLEV